MIWNYNVYMPCDLMLTKRVALFVLFWVVFVLRDNAATQWKKQFFLILNKGNVIG